MSASRSGRLLLRSLLAVAGGVAACADGVAGQDAGLGELGSLAPGGSGGGATSTAGSGGRGGGGTAGGGAAGASSATRFCEAPHPLLVDGQATGMIACADGSLERSAASTCRLPTEPLDPYCDPANGLEIGGYNSYAHPCETLCTSDADCPENKACACRPDGVGVCAIGECRTTADCASGRSCHLASVYFECMGAMITPYLWCVGPEDVCASDADCAEGKGPCGARDADGRLRCDRDVTRPPSSCGRPILVEATPRVATVVRGVPWVSGGSSVHQPYLRKECLHGLPRYEVAGEVSAGGDWGQRGVFLERRERRSEGQRPRTFCGSERQRGRGCRSEQWRGGHQRWRGRLDRGGRRLHRRDGGCIRRSCPRVRLRMARAHPRPRRPQRNGQVC